MYPRIFTTPYFTLHTFGVLLAFAFLAAMCWAVRGAKREVLNPDLLIGLGLWAIVGGVAGAKLLLVLRTLPEYVAQPSLLFSSSFIESAGDFYGGFDAKRLSPYSRKAVSDFDGITGPLRPPEVDAVL